MEDTQGTQPVVAPQPNFNTTTLAAQGPQLPVGIADSAGSLVKDIAVRPWRMKEEREIGDLRDKNRDGNMFQYVSMVLATLATKLGPYDFDKMKPEERRVVIAGMTMPDVFYAYVWLRLQALGPDFDLRIVCPSCRKKSEITADLNTIEVRAVAKIDDASWPYTVAIPFTIRGKQANTLMFGPPRWTALENAPKDERLNTGAVKALVIRSSIVGVNTDGQVQLADSELDEMSKRDLEKITKLTDDKSIGPIMQLDCKCPNCTAPVKTPIDWNYDSFFAASSK